MAKPEWGAKHRCSSCGKPFYDMKRTPLICPSCGAKHVVEKLLKSRKMSSAASKAPVAVVKKDLEDDVDETETNSNPTEDNISVDDDGDDDLSAVVIPKSTSDDN